MKKADRKRLNRVIFCANQISLCIAVALARRDCDVVRTAIFFTPARCDSQSYQDSDVELVPYGRMSFLSFFLRNIFERPDEVCIPHMKMGGMIKLYAKYGRVLSLSCSSALSLIFLALFVPISKVDPWRGNKRSEAM
jgi:hypothetical protein